MWLPQCVMTTMSRVTSSTWLPRSVARWLGQLDHEQTWAGAARRMPNPAALEAFAMGGSQRLGPSSYCHVDFRGGPLDGHTAALSVEELAVFLAVPVSAGILATLAGNPSAPCHAPSSIAIYELETQHGASPSYVFCRSMAPELAPVDLTGVRPHMS